MTKVPFLALVSLALVAFYSPSLHAKPVPCLTENAQISITLNDTETDIGVIKNKFDEKISAVEKAAKEAGAEKFNLQSSNYNVSPQNYGGGMDKQYLMSGSVTFHVEPPSKALAIMTALTKKGFAVSINVNSYNNGTGNCAETVPGDLED